MSTPERAGVREEGLSRPPRRLARSRLFMLVVAVLLVLGIGVRVAVPPAYRWVKAKRARKAAGEAERLLGEGRLEDSARFSRVAYELAPNEAEVLRVVARLSAQLGRSDSVSHYLAYRATGQMSQEDRIAMAEAAVRFGRIDVARPLLGELTAERPTDRHVWRLALASVRQTGDLAKSVALARSVVSRFGGDAEAEFALASLLVGSGQAGWMGEGQRILWGLALGRTAMDQQAVQMLAVQPDLKPAEAETLARVLESVPTNSLPRALLTLQLRMRSQPARTNEWFEKAVALVPTNGPVPEVCQLVLWLTERDGLAFAGGHLPEVRCRTNLLLMAARLDYLVGIDDSAGLATAVADTGNVLDAGMRSAAVGALAAKQGRRDEGERALRAALDAGGSRAMLVAPFVARVAERHRLNAVAVQALQVCMEAPGREMEVARGILRLLELDPNPTQGLATLRRLHSKVPTEDAVILERAWLELLAGENSAWALTELKRIAGFQPEDGSVRFALALAEWRNGQASQALMTIEKGPVDLESLIPRQRAVYAVVLGANDQREAARRIARGIPTGPGAATYEALLQPWR